MSSAGQAIGGVIGAVVGFFVPGVGPVMGAQIGLTVGGAIDPPKGPTIQGPRLDDLSVQSASYGVPIPRVYGTIAVLGNVLWLENNQLREVKTTEEQGGKGGGGGATTETFTYFATFAVGLCRGPIAGVRRIWIGSDLIYDAESTEPDVVVASGGSIWSQVIDIITAYKKIKFTVYNGTDTQQPDPRIQGDRGAANVSAYRGLAYIVFEDLPLEKYGNSLMGAQVKVELVSAQSDAVTTSVWESVTVDDVSGWYGAQFSTPLSRNFEGVLFRTLAVDHATTPTLWRCVEHTYFRSTVYDLAPISSAFFLVPTYAVGDFRFCFATSGCEILAIESTEYPTGFTGLGTDPAVSVLKVGDLVFVAAKNTSSTAAALAVFTSGGRLSSAAFTASNTPRLVHNGGDDTVLMIYATTVETYDATTGALLSSGTTSATINLAHGLYIDDGVLYACINVSGTQSLRGYDLINFAQISTLSLPTIGGSGSVSAWSLGDVMARANDLTDRNIEIIKLVQNVGELVTLDSIVNAECLLSETLTLVDVDTSALTSTVRGYKVSATGSARGALLPLQGAWPFDVVQTGYTVTFLPRGSASVATIESSELDAAAAGNARGTLIIESREMDSVLPVKVNIKYIDANRDYDSNEQFASRSEAYTMSVNKLELEMAIVLTSTEAAKKADVLLYMYWLERYDISFKLPPSYQGLEPADVITINGDNATYEVRLTSINYLPDGRLECAGKFNSAAIYTSEAEGSDGDSTGVSINLPGPNAFVLLDIPATITGTEYAGFIAAMSGFTPSWRSGVLYKSADGGQTWSNVVGFAGPCVIGTATTTISAAVSTMIDKASVLAVRLYSGELVSVSELSMLNGANHFAYGANGRWEIIAAQDCVLQGDGSYLVSNFLRGRFGTERYTGTHAVNDHVVLLTDADVAFLLASTATIGASVLYRGLNNGQSLDSVSDYPFTYAGVNLKPLSPVYLNGNRHPTTNNWTLTWIRQTRTGGEWRDFVDAALSETTESYSIDVFSDGTYTTVKRTLTASTPTVSYTSANQVTDFGSNQATVFVRVYQISEAIGRGYPLEQSLTR